MTSIRLKGRPSALVSFSSIHKPHTDKHTTMTPIAFEHSNVIFGEGQPEYLPLHALRFDDESGTTITCWKLEEEDLKAIQETGVIWLSQLIFMGPLQPVRLSVDKPFDIVPFVSESPPVPFRDAPRPAEEDVLSKPPTQNLKDHPYYEG